MNNLKSLFSGALNFNTLAVYSRPPAVKEERGKSSRFALCVDLVLPSSLHCSQARVPEDSQNLPLPGGVSIQRERAMQVSPCGAISSCGEETAI